MHNAPLLYINRTSVNIYIYHNNIHMHIISYMRYDMIFKYHIFYTRVINIKYENIILKIIRKYNVKIDFLNDTPEKIYAYSSV
jgi:hypothetical protein